MGLDWHAQTEATLLEQESHKQKYPDRPPLGSVSPCAHVNAPKAGEREAFEQDMQEILDWRREDSKGQGGGYYKYWHDMTLERLMEEERDKYDCKNCPLLSELQGADSTCSMGLGITVSSCDFRGKRISSDDATPEDVVDEAYDPHSTMEMRAFADRLEDVLESMKSDGLCEKEPYAEYAAEWQAESFHWSPLLTEEEWDKTPHWREQNYREAIHWLRTLASRGISMGTSY